MVEILLPAEDRRAINVWLQDQPAQLKLLCVDGDDRLFVDWPRSDPGRYRLRIEHHGELVEDHKFTVSPKKISTSSYSQLIEDLENRLPATVAMGLKRLGALAGVEIRPPGANTLAAELYRIRQALEGTSGRPGFAAVLEGLADDPHQMLESIDHWVPTRKARRPHPARLVEALVHGSNLDSNGRPLRVLDNRVEHTVDLYENQLLLLFHRQLSFRLRRLRGVLEGRPDWAPLVAEVDELTRRLDLARRRAAFLDEVTPPSHLTARLTMVMLKRPLYRAALEIITDFHRSVVVKLEELDLDSPLRKLPMLYQLWGTLVTLVVFQEVAAQLGYRVHKERLFKTTSDGSLILQFLPDNRETLVVRHPDGTSASFIPERTYGSSGQLRSRTRYNQRPDIAVEVKAPGETVRVYLFDPKYKLDSEVREETVVDYRPKKEDVDKMHAYIDAIRDAEDRPAVRQATILYPGPAEDLGDGLSALSAAPGGGGDFRSDLGRILRQALLPKSAPVGS